MSGEPGTPAWLVQALGLLAAVILVGIRIFGPDLSGWLGGGRPIEPSRDDTPDAARPEGPCEWSLAKITAPAVVLPMVALLFWASTLAGRDSADPNRRTSTTTEFASATIIAIREWPSNGSRIAAFDLEFRVDRPGQDPDSIVGMGRLVMPTSRLRANPDLRPVVGGSLPVFVEPGPPQRMRIVEEPWGSDDTPVLPFVILIVVGCLGFIALLRAIAAPDPPQPSPPR